MTEERDPKLPGLIEVSLVGGEWSLKIDGQEFPWYVIGDDLAPQIQPIRGEDLSYLTITIPAERLTANLDTCWPDRRGLKAVGES